MYGLLGAASTSQCWREVEIHRRWVVSPPFPVGRTFHSSSIIPIQQSHERGPIERILACELDPGSLQAGRVHDHLAGRG